MATNWPNSVQTFSTVSSGDSLNSPSHSGLHNDVSDTVEALQEHAGLVLVKTQTISNGAGSVTVTDAFPSTFNEFQIVGDIVLQTNSTTVFLQLSGITGNDYDGTVYFNTFGGVSAESFQANNNLTYWDIGHWRYGGSMFIGNPNFGRFKTYNFGIVSDVTYMRRGGGRCQSNTTATGFTLTPATGLFGSGTIRIYGYNKG